MFATTFIHKDIQEKLEHAILQDRVPHALYLKSPDGGGNLPIAIAIANELLNAKKPHGLFGDIREDVRALSLTHPDLNIVFPVQQIEKKRTCESYISEFREFYLKNNYITFDDWLEEVGHADKKPIISVHEAQSIIRKLSLKPFEASGQVLIIWQPEKMNAECANKLLKIIEEPEPGNVIIMVGNEWDKLLTTIKSRVQLIRIKPFSSDQIKNYLHLKENIEIDLAQEIAEKAEGIVSNALKLLNEDGKEEIEKLISQFLRLSMKGNKVGLIDLSAQFHGLNTVDRVFFFKELSDRIRKAFFMEKITHKQAEHMQKGIDSALYSLKRNAHAKTLFLNFSLKACKLLNPVVQA
ncbi:MAG: hypothetical protein AAF487_14510 [Bacteroidota bacterium]